VSLVLSDCGEARLSSRHSRAYVRNDAGQTHENLCEGPDVRQSASRGHRSETAHGRPDHASRATVRGPPALLSDLGEKREREE